MGEADITEKLLEAYDDVFSDIINVLLFDGKRLVKEDELSDAVPLSGYIVADYFVQIRRNKEYRPSAETIRHVHEVLQLMAVLTKDRRFEEVQIPRMAEGGIAMCEVLDRVERRGFIAGQHDGFIAGQHDGFIAGQQKGQNTILALANRLIASGRIDDLSRASTDSEYLTRLLKEEGLQTAT